MRLSNNAKRNKQAQREGFADERKEKIIMGLQVEIKNDKYRFYSTMVNAHHTGWIGRNEALRFLINRARLRYMDEVVEIVKCFPYKYCGKDNKMILDNKKEALKYRKWCCDRYNEGNDPDDILKEEFDKLMNELKEGKSYDTEI